jgi:hypothetical protein
MQLIGGTLPAGPEQENLAAHAADTLGNHGTKSLGCLIDLFVPNPDPWSRLVTSCVVSDRLSCAFLPSSHAQ